jgi:acetate kinase
MRVLAVNAGSSSLKFALVDTGAAGGVAAGRPASGLIAELGRSRSAGRFRLEGAEPDDVPGAGSHGEAMERVLRWLDGHGLRAGLEATGHRVVHGGRRFTAPALIDDAVLEAIDALRELAPLHNGVAVEALRAARAALPGVPAVATFDTAFHAALPEVAARYAIDPELADRHGARRYGFHGLAHRSMLEDYARHAGRPPEALRLVTFQLGNGCSAAAVRDGRSIDTTMGLTPLEGLVMGTRSGDVDPALIGFLARREGTTAEEVEQLLNHRSGLLGLSGRTADMRTLLEAEAAGDRRAALAVDLFCYRARKTLGAYLAALGGADAVVFGGGIGANAAAVRARICAGMEWSGLRMDAEANAALAAPASLSPAGARPEVYVAEVDEETAIAQDAAGCVAAGREAASAAAPLR